MEAFRAAFTAAALGVFGSGWACLVCRRGELSIETLANQETVITQANPGASPLLLLDVWEHAYYLKYKNARADYIKAAWNVLTYAPLRG
jgi:Fe-Mn family superoxide dismutase